MYLLVDATNIFIRCYTVVPTLGCDGQRIGGVSGFLKSLGFLVRTLEPTKVILCWDGPGGSQKRRSIFKDYKLGRKPSKPARLNKNFEFEEESIQENKIYQRRRLAEYLKDLPVSQLIMPNIEADDVIAFLCKMYKEENKVIVSNDKDFHQLLDEKTRIYKPGKKEFYEVGDLMSEYNIYPYNFALARAVVGDKSDNLPGVSGLGFKSLSKYFPILSEDRKLEVSDVESFCLEKLEEKKASKKYGSFIEQKSVVDRNYKVMQLYNPIISATSIGMIQDALKAVGGFNMTFLQKKLLEDGIELSGLFFKSMRVLSVKSKG